MSRSSSDKHREALKIAFGQAVESVGGGVLAALLTRVKPTALSNYAAPQEEERHAALDVAFDLDKAMVDAGGEPMIGRAYLALLGFEIVRAKPVRDGRKLTLADLRKLMSEEHDLETVLLDALEDGEVTPAERTRIKRELGGLRRQLALIEAKVGGG